MDACIFKNLSNNSHISCILLTVRAVCSVVMSQNFALSYVRSNKIYLKKNFFHINTRNLATSKSQLFIQCKLTKSLIKIHHGLGPLKEKINAKSASFRHLVATEHIAATLAVPPQCSSIK